MGKRQDDVPGYLMYKFIYPLLLSEWQRLIFKHFFVNNLNFFFLLPLRQNNASKYNLSMWFFLSFYFFCFWKLIWYRKLLLPAGFLLFLFLQTRIQVVCLWFGALCVWVVCFSWLAGRSLAVAWSRWFCLLPCSQCALISLQGHGQSFAYFEVWGLAFFWFYPNWFKITMTAATHSPFPLCFVFPCHMETWVLLWTYWTFRKCLIIFSE